MPNLDPAQAFNENDVAPAVGAPAFDEFQAMRNAAITAPPPQPLQASPADIAVAQAAGVAIPPAMLPAAPAPPMGIPPLQPAPVPVAPAVPGVPLPGPGGGGAGVPRGPDPMAGATGEVRAAGQEQTDTARSGVDVAKQSAEDLAKADQMRAVEAQASADRLTALQKRQETAYNESKGAFDQAKKDVSNFKFHDFFANKSFAQQALAGIGMLLGGASYDANHVNQAVGVVQSAIKLDSDQQLSYLHSKEHLAELAQAGVRDTQSYLAHEMVNFQTAEALKKEAVARQIDQFSSSTRGKQNIVAAQQVAAGLRVSAAKDAQSAILQGTHNRVMQSQIGLNNANAAHARAAAGAAEAGKKDAEELKVAGAIDRRLKSDPTTNTIIKSIDSLIEAKAAIATGNPVAIQGALDSYIRAQTALGARPGSIKMFQARLGGSLEQLNAWVQEKKTGALPPAMVQRFSSAVDDAFGQRSGEAKKMADLHVKLMLKSPEYSRHPEVVKAHVADIFHQGGEEAAAGAGPPDIKTQAKAILADPAAPANVKERARSVLAAP